MKKNSTILCVDDDNDILLLLENYFSKTRFNVLTADSGAQALDILDSHHCDIVLLDYQLGDINGLEVLKKIKEKEIKTDVLMLTAHSDVSLIVRAMKLGASDYILKPIDGEQLFIKVEKTAEIHDLKKENVLLKQQLSDKHRFKNIIGASVPMQQVFSIIGKVANQDNTVLIQGESGTGKELVAKAIHYNGSRAKKMFIPVDCGSISPNLIESELFGHTKGAFTGAHQKKTGLMKAAGDGTLFFDEIGELPLQMQTKLLRSLQEREIRPVGSNETEKIYARIIAATNKNLLKAVDKGEFRIDLFYRLNVVFIDLPPLRERKDDIPVLVRHFIEKFSRSQNRIERVDQKAMDMMMEYSWPGNVRELENCIERAFALGAQSVLKPEDLPGFSQTSSPGDASVVSTRKTLEETVKELIIKALVFTGGNKLEAARVLGVSRSSLYSKMSKYNLQ